MKWALAMAMAGCADGKEPPCADGFERIGERCEAGNADSGLGPEPSSDDTAGTDDTGSVPDSTNARIDAGSEVICAAPQLRSEREFESPQGPADQNTEASPWNPIAAAGFSVADFDADGRLDLFLPQVGADQLYLDFLSEGAGDSAATHLPSGLSGPTAGSVAVDIEGDGDQDLFVVRPEGDHLLLINDGTGHFSDGTAAAGLAEQGWPAVGGVFTDANADGDLDLFVMTYRTCDESLGPLPENPYTDSPQALWENQGDGVFTDVSERIPEHPEGRSRQRAALWLDADRDGDPDVYTVSDRGYISECMVNNQFFRNEGGGYTDDSEATSLGLQMEGMGVGFGDINGDGVVDIAMSDMQRMWLMESDGLGGWYDATFARGLGLESASDGRWSGWGTEMADVDNDGDLDLFIAFGGLPDAPSGGMNPWSQPDGLWIQGDDGSFAAVADEWEVANEASNRAAHLADLNGDGWLDLMTREIGGEVAVRLAQCGEGGWVSVSLRGLGANRDAIGAKVEVVTDQGTQTRWVTQGSRGLQSSMPPAVHFGLGTQEELALTVTWTDGETSTFRNIEPNRSLRVERIP